MVLKDFLGHLRRLGAQLWLDEDQLRFRAPKGALSADDMNTLRASREQIIALLRTASANAPVLLEPVRRDVPIPLPHSQERLWLIQTRDGNRTYNVHGAVTLQGSLSLDRLQHAFNALATRHEPLRTRFDFIPGTTQLAQLIDPPGAVVFELKDVSIDDVSAELVSHTNRLFDVQTGPLFRVLVLRVSAHQHVLSVAMHHIISDGWSIGVLIRDVQALYAGRPLAPLTIQYADYAHWQRRQDVQPHLEYWAGKLGGYDVPLDLSPAGTPVQAPGPVRTLKRTLTSALCEKLGRLSERQGCSLFSLFIAALAIIAHRQTRRCDLCLGTTIAGRDDPALEPLIGFFVNILPLRLNLSGDPTVTQLLDRSRNVVLEALDHRALAFEQMLSAVPELRQGNGRSIVPIMIRHQNFPEADVQQWGEGLVAQPTHEVGDRAAYADLDLEIYGDSRGLEVHAHFDSLRISPAQLELTLSLFETVLERFTREPHTKLSSFCQPDALELALFAQSTTTQHFTQTDSVTQLFARQVMQRPDAMACVDAREALSYRALHQRADQIARRLVSIGVKRQARIALHVPRSADLLAALLATVRLGCVYVPLDTAYPLAYRTRILDDVKPTVVLADASLVECAYPVLRIDTAGSEGLADVPQVHTTADDLICIAYTSGSTGEPKGVMVEHRQLLNCLHALWERTPFEADEVVGQRTSVSFVPSIKELLGGLLVGVPQVILPDLLVRDTPALAKSLKAHGVTRLNLVPSHLAVLLDHSDQLTHLRHVTTAGEPLGRDLVTRFAQLLPRATLHNNYGCTELNDITYACADDLIDISNVASIGRPIANVRVHVLDDALNEVPVLAVGTLYVEGASVGPGYWNRPDLTRERFIDLNGKRLLSTGDQAQWLPDGRLLHLGRVDFQLKIRGQRVELPAVELALASHPDIEKAAVIGQHIGTPAARLLGFFVLKPGATVDRMRLHAWLTERLPGAMVPSRFEVLGALPVLSNGKLDRRALEALELNDTSQTATSYEAPLGDVEAVVAQIWSQLLGIQQVGRRDNFFALGGYSLQASHVVAQIRQKLKIDVPIRAVFESLTLQELAQAVIDASNHAKAAANSLEAYNVGGTQAPLFLAHTLFGSSAYVKSLAGYLHADLPVYALPALPLGSAYLSTLPEMAAQFVLLIKQVQPQGPYRIGGWSYGGLLAYEVASQLQAQGESIERVVVLDATLPAHCAVNSDMLLSRERLRMVVLYTFMHENFSHFDAQHHPLVKLETSQALLDGLLDEIETRRNHEQPLWYLSYGSREQNRLFFERLLAHGDALYDWRARPTSLHLQLFRAIDTRETPLSGHDHHLPALGWEYLLPAEQLRTIAVEGNHRSMMREHIRELAVQINTALGLADVSAGVSP